MAVLRDSPTTVAYLTRIRVQDHVRSTLLRWMDLTTLLSWRATSRSNYAEACLELKGFLHFLAGLFVPDAGAVLSLITDCRAMIAGEIALAFVLRDPNFMPTTMEIYVANIWANMFIENFCGNPALNGYGDSFSLLNHFAGFAQQRHITRSFESYLMNGNVIVIHISDCPSACNALAYATCTAAMTFVTKHAFGTAYPRLTLNRHCLVSTERVLTAADTDLLLINKMESCEFTFVSGPPETGGELRATAARPSGSTHHLVHHRDVCPHRARYFGDDSSLVGFMDPLGCALLDLRRRSIPPYGIMAVWRIPCLEDCEEGCGELDDMLMPRELSTYIVFEQ